MEDPKTLYRLRPQTMICLRRVVGIAIGIAIGNAYSFGAAFIDSHRLAAAPPVAAQEMGFDGGRRGSMGFDRFGWDSNGFDRT